MAPDTQAPSSVSRPVPLAERLYELGALLAFSLAYLVVAALAALRQGNAEFVMYIGVMLAFGLLVWAVDRWVRFSHQLLWALSVWGLLHMAGGLMPAPEGWAINGKPVLYSLWIVEDRLKYDHLVHAYGFGITTWACWQALRSRLERSGRPAEPGWGVLVLCAAAGMGFGAFNEVAEFAATLLVPDTNVGGYRNTGWDLVANLVGAAIAIVIIRTTAARRREPGRTGTIR